MRSRLLWITLIALILPSSAAAHSAPFSYLDLNVGDDQIAGSLVVHIVDAAHELGVDPPERLLAEGIAAVWRDRLTALLTPRLTIRSNRILRPEWQSIEVLPEQSGLRLTFRIDTPRPDSLTLLARLFPYDPVHQTFVNVYEEGTLRQQMVFGGTPRPAVTMQGRPRGRSP